MRFEIKKLNVVMLIFILNLLLGPPELLTFSNTNVYCGHRLTTTAYSCNIVTSLSNASSAKGEVE